MASDGELTASGHGYCTMAIKTLTITFSPQFDTSL